jgi:hypothetical protein
MVQKRNTEHDTSEWAEGSMGRAIEDLSVEIQTLMHLFRDILVELLRKLN